MSGKGGKLSVADKDEDTRDGAFAHQHREKVCASRLGGRVTKGLSLVFQCG